MNSVNNIHKYFTHGTPIYLFLTQWIQEITLGCLACSIVMVFSRKIVFKVAVAVGIVLYNLLILSYHVIVPNYYALREWLAILGAVFVLMAIDQDDSAATNSKI